MESDINMSNYRVCVYAISKNEEQFVDRWMDAVSEADLVVVTDTGSTDKTVEKLRERGAIVYEEHIQPWRFDVARNIAMDHIPADMDICVSNDLDEVFESGWRQKLETAWKPTYTRARYLFAWSHTADGAIHKQFSMEKIHRRHEFRWVHPVHEVLEYSGADPDRVVWVHGLILHHYPDNTKPRSQYLPLLELSAQENPQDDRAMFWLGREYFYYKKYTEAVSTLKKHLALPSATWAEERSASMGFIAQCYQATGNPKEALSWLYRALAECPDVREPYLGVVKFVYNEKNWPLVYALAQRGLSITSSTGSYLVQAECWGPALYDYGAIAAYQMGLFDAAEVYALKAWELEPENARLEKNLALIRQKIQGATPVGGAK